MWLPPLILTQENKRDWNSCVCVRACIEEGVSVCVSVCLSSLCVCVSLSVCVSACLYLCVSEHVCLCVSVCLCLSGFPVQSNWIMWQKQAHYAQRITRRKK